MKVFAKKLIHTFLRAYWIALAAIVSMVLMMPGRSLTTPDPNQLELLSLSEARSYMLDLINRDRATANLKPLKLDIVATSAGQKHSDEMANYGYISHYNLDGKSPDQRYSENGGDYYNAYRR